jgi:hypothetical protein
MLIGSTFRVQRFIGLGLRATTPQAGFKGSGFRDCVFGFDINQIVLIIEIERGTTASRTRTRTRTSTIQDALF